MNKKKCTKFTKFSHWPTCHLQQIQQFICSQRLIIIDNENNSHSALLFGGKVVEMLEIDFFYRQLPWREHENGMKFVKRPIDQKCRWKFPSHLVYGFVCIIITLLLNVRTWGNWSFLFDEIVLGNLMGLKWKLFYFFFLNYFWNLKNLKFV